MLGDIDRLTSCFFQIDVRPPDGPGHFAFFVPSDEAYRRWPHYPEAARPEARRAAGGKGLSPESCRASGVGEAVERASCCAWPDERLVYARIKDLGAEALLPDALLGFSRSQIQDRTVWNKRYSGVDWCPPPVSFDVEFAWTTMHNAVSGFECLVPADHTLIGRRSPGDPAAVSVATSSGCAAGATMEQAKLAAILELLERDAIGRWWFGQRFRPTQDPCDFSLPDDLLNYLSRRLRRTTLFDISTDLWSPIIAAVSWEPDGSKVAMGFAARHHTLDTIEHALVEMLQIEIGLEQRLTQGQDSIHTWCAQVSARTSPLSCGVMGGVLPRPQGLSEGLSLARLLERLSSNAIDVYFADRTRPEFGIPVVRAIAPGLCSDKPRWGWPRLLGPDLNDCAPINYRDVNWPPNELALRI